MKQYGRALSIDRGIQNLFRPSSIVFVERGLDLNQPQDLVSLATEYLPDYLRWAEHVFGNLIEFYWAIRKKGGVDGKFNIRRATEILEQKQLERMVRGYSDEVRNGIAHGEITFTGFGIEFGTAKPSIYSSSDFLRLYDELCRTCNSLTVALILFWERGKPGEALRDSIPLGIVTRFAAGGVNRTGLKLLGVVESTTPLAGRQLHVAVSMSMLKRAMVFGESARIAFHLIEAGAKGYDRFLIQVDQGKGVSSLVIIDTPIFRKLLETDAPAARLSEAFPETQLLWFDETTWKTRLRAWRIILLTGLGWVKEEILRSWGELGIWRVKGRYQIREVEQLGSQGVSRIRVRAVLRKPVDAEDRETVRAVISDIVSRYRRRFVRSKGQYLDSGVPWPKRPRYVFVDLFRVDGTIRWLRGGGWAEGNLVAVAEYVRGSAEPVLIETPEEMYKGIRIRYTMNTEMARKAWSDLAKFTMDIRQRRDEINNET